MSITRTTSLIEGWRIFNVLRCIRVAVIAIERVLFIIRRE